MENTQKKVRWLDGRFILDGKPLDDGDVVEWLSPRGWVLDKIRIDTSEDRFAAFGRAQWLYPGTPIPMITAARKVLVRRPMNPEPLTP